MRKLSWHLSRRTFLRGCGVSLALPYLECMGSEQGGPSAPTRFCAAYFPYGIVLEKAESEKARWNWFPAGSGRDFQFGEGQQALNPLRDELTILSGLSHPHGRQMGGHDTADIWLTAAELKGGQLKNSVSFDQLLAQHYGNQTRYSSLVLSSDGGVGEPTRSSTLSFGSTGSPIPAQNQPRPVFERLFGIHRDSRHEQNQQLENATSMLDSVLEHSRSLRRRLGKPDQVKLDEYLDSVRQIEQRVERSQAWLDVPKPDVDAGQLHLDADDSTPRELIRTMYDLIFLAFQTDSTRVATYQIGNMNGATSIAGKFPQLLGISDGMHRLAHNARKGTQGAEGLGRWHQFLSAQMANFLNRLKSTPEADGTLLDHTIVLYGSSNSHTHVNRNYPLMLAGGKATGLRHGQFVQLDEQTPLSNLYVTLMNRAGLPTERFVDSTGEQTDILG